LQPFDWPVVVSPLDPTRHDRIDSYWTSAHADLFTASYSLICTRSVNVNRAHGRWHLLDAHPERLACIADLVIRSYDGRCNYRIAKQVVGGG
jgi:hypothetical protein